MPFSTRDMRLLLRNHDLQSVEEEFFARRTVRAAVGAPRPAPPLVGKPSVPKKNPIEKIEIRLKVSGPDFIDLNELREYFMKKVMTSLSVPSYMFQERTGNSSAASTRRPRNADSSE